MHRVSGGEVSLPNGTSRRVHADETMDDVEQAIASTFARLRAGVVKRVAERDGLSRQLAGVIGNCEALRRWIERGAPE